MFQINYCDENKIGNSTIPTQYPRSAGELSHSQKLATTRNSSTIQTRLGRELLHWMHRLGQKK